MPSIDEYKEIIHDLRIEKPGEALAHLASLQKIAEDNHDRELLAYCHYYNADCYLTLADTENCIREAHIALDYYQDGDDTPEDISGIGLCYNLLSIAYIQQADIAHALQALGEVIRLASQHDNPYLGMLAHINYSELCLLNGLTEEGYTHALQAEVCYFEDGEKDIARYLRTMNLADLVNTSMKLRRYDIARANIDKLRTFIAKNPDMAETPNYMLAELFRADEGRADKADATEGRRPVTAASVVDTFLSFPSIAELGAEIEMLIQYLLEEKNYMLLEKLLDRYATEVEGTPFLGPRLTVAKYQVSLYRATGNTDKLVHALSAYYDCNESKALFEGHNAMSLLSTSSALQHSEEQNAILRKKAETDELTGVANRRHLNDLLDTLFAEAVAKHLPLMVEMLDIDDFKAINDESGHIVGDRVLIRLGHVLRKICKDPKYHGRLHVGRYGGDEFTLVGVGIAKEEVQELTERIRSLVLEHKPAADGPLPPFTISRAFAAVSPTIPIRSGTSPPLQIQPSITSKRPAKAESSSLPIPTSWASRTTRKQSPGTGNTV